MYFFRTKKPKNKNKQKNLFKLEVFFFLNFCVNKAFSIRSLSLQTGFAQGFHKLSACVLKIYKMNQFLAFQPVKSLL